MAQLKSNKRYNPYGERINTIEAPDLLEMQKDSFEWFLKEGLKEELKAISPIVGYAGKFELEFTGAIKIEDPKYSPQECLIREITYQAPVNVTAKLIDKESGEIKVQDVFIGDLPLMTDRATFIINGAERVIVSQLVRSSGVFFREVKVSEKSPKKFYYATIVPDRGSWLEFEVDSAGVVFARINRTKKIAATKFLAAIGCTKEEIENVLVDNEIKRKTLKEAPIKPKAEALLELYRKLRPGDPVTKEGAEAYLHNMFFNNKRYDLGKVGRHKMNVKLGINVPESKRVLTKQDLLETVKYLINLNRGEGLPDDIDHLGNRRIRAVGELLQRQFRVGLLRVERLIREQMVMKSNEKVSPQQLINIRPIAAVLREFFGSSQLSQFMDQTNPLSELTHKRRLSALGPGGLTRERAGFEVRDIHPSHYGRVCPIETPEGPNAGIIASLATFAKVNKFGFIETPYFKVVNGKITDKIEYMTADEEDLHKIGPCDLRVDSSNRIVDHLVPVRFRREFVMVPAEEVEYVGVHPAQVFSITTSLIPFLEHDDANRALMGSNMQRQAVPLLNPEAPFVGTGLEKKAAMDSKVPVVAENSGVVTKVTSTEIVIKTDSSKPDVYPLIKFQRSNQNTCLHQRPIVSVGDKVKRGDVIADGSTTANGEIAMGKNVLVGFMPWEGFNFEDSILISERLVMDDVFTSVHIERFEIDVRSTKLGKEEITREIPNVSEDALKNLDERGVIRVGAEVKSGDILVGKVTPKGESELPAEEKLLRAIFGDKARDMRDSSLRVPPGEGGKVIAVRIFSREEGDELPPGVHEIVRVYVAQMRKISVGDKMAGRHGNKGVVSRILPVEDMPYLPDGTPLDIVLNPLGVPSRMNVGQIFELLLGEAARILGKYYEVPSFDESIEEDASIHLVEKELEEAARISGLHWISKDGKVEVRDGRTGKPFDRKIVCGCMYVMKLIHLVDDKMHARSTGPYSLITQQPLGGKAQFGGQRLGELAVWALESYGAAHILQEFLTVKSDDVGGRAKIYESMIKGKPMTNPGTPESFKVLVKELRSLALDLKLVTKDGKEISLDEDSKPSSKLKAKNIFAKTSFDEEK